MQLITWSEEYLEGIVNLWNEEVGEQFPMRKELFKQNSFDDENILLDGSSLVVSDSGDVIGFIVTKTWNEPEVVEMAHEVGWIQVLLVDSAYRNQGIGSALLEKAEKALKTKGVKLIKIGADPWHYFPGIPQEYGTVQKWFESKGYSSSGQEHDLLGQYDSSEKALLPQRNGVTFTLLKEHEKEQLLAFLKRCFPGRWEYEAMKYFQKGGTGREFVVLKRGHDIIGFCRINDERSPFIAQNVYWTPLFKAELGGIGPLGVDRAERKKGYGIAIVEAAITYLRERDIQQIVIDWTGLVDFYGKLGYGVWKSYEKYAKKLE